jgi:hypothetical protein
MFCQVWGIWEDRFKEIKDTYIGWDMQVGFHWICLFTLLICGVDELPCATTG